MNAELQRRQLIESKAVSGSWRRRVPRGLPSRHLAQSSLHGVGSHPPRLSIDRLMSSRSLRVTVDLIGR